MSFKSNMSSMINSTLDNTIKSYINIISKKYNLSEKELNELWNGGVSDMTPSSSKVVANTELDKLSKGELIEMCKSKNLKVSGTKSDLVARILAVETKATPATTTIVKKLVDKLPVFQIKKNSHGNYEHKDTGFIFDSKTQKVYGKQNEDGSISELTLEDIENCKKFKFLYMIPTNLDKQNSVDVKIDELDEDDVVEDDDEEFEYEDEEEVEEEEFYEE